mmetsp:Transcript_7439/g.13876  ORF Transcript_7439/g.13876 Transcript_7439/m.13876 type:complete len:374 (-) Transcript_7439:98-1219(-)|eukprot:CAMPEP_0197518688 /NCGR_PEP_ID=MMETSP1318-20131121/3919_1 /TAXON_ID=552666 /ORGANISM="Partenskyella glossopodia, Strain RCC365" /LENGTH=373 /DNA_ID=CAMNT_0043069225 /DNA_START=54 /DNA_END=1175 /DNA_ORIENTATION=-
MKTFGLGARTAVVVAAVCFAALLASVSSAGDDGIRARGLLEATAMRRAEIAAHARPTRTLARMTRANALLPATRHYYHSGKRMEDLSVSKAALKDAKANKISGSGAEVALSPARPKFRMQGSSSTLARNVKVNSILGVGFPELVIIVGLASVLIGPQGMIQAARSVATFIKDLQPALKELAEQTSDVQDVINKELGINEIADTIYETQREIQNVQNELTNTFNVVNPLRPPPPPPPPPSLSNQEDDVTADIDLNNDAAPAELSAAEIEELKKPKFWNPRDEASSIDVEAAANLAQDLNNNQNQPQSQTQTKLDGEEIFQKAVAMAQARQQEQAVQPQQDSDKEMVALTPKQIELLRKAEAEEEVKRKIMGEED